MIDGIDEWAQRIHQANHALNHLGFGLQSHHQTPSEGFVDTHIKRLKFVVKRALQTASRPVPVHQQHNGGPAIHRMTRPVLFEQMGHKTFKRPPAVDGLNGPGEPEMQEGSDVAPSFDQQRKVQLPVACTLFGQSLGC